MSFIRLSFQYTIQCAYFFHLHRDMVGNMMSYI